MPLLWADFETLDGADAVECYNGGCDVESDRGYSWHFIDMLLHRGHRVGAIATDDVHAAEGSSDFMRGWVQVKAEALEPEALLRGAQSRALLFEYGTPTAQCRV